MMIFLPLSTLAALVEETNKRLDPAWGVTPAEAERGAWELVVDGVPYPDEFTQIVFFAGPNPKVVAPPAPDPGDASKPLPSM